MVVEYKNAADHKAGGGTAAYTMLISYRNVVDHKAGGQGPLQYSEL